MSRFHYIALILVLIAGCAAWGALITHRGYDYDEVLRAHSSWLTSQGLRPYQDFFESHPPYFALFSPLVRGETDPGTSLMTLRLVAAVGNLLFLAGLVVLATNGDVSRWPLAALGTALVSFHPVVLKFLGEFRVDGWGYALATWSIVLLLRSRPTWRLFIFGVGTGISTLLFCPKLALLPPMIFVIEQFKARKAWKYVIRDLAMYASGVVFAGGLFCCWLAANGISLNLTIACVAKYNALSNFHSGFGCGLLLRIAVMPFLSLPILAGFLAWIIQCLRTKSLVGVYPAALALWLSVQAMTVSYPYKQYYGPWLLFGSAFFPFLYYSLEAIARRAMPAIFFGLCALSVTVSTINTRLWIKSNMLQNHEKMLQTLNQITYPDDFIVTVPLLHPIDRRDTFYLSCNTIDPNGHDTETVLEMIPLLHDRVSESRYREELTMHPPVLVILQPDLYPHRQRAVLDEFLKERGYIHTTIGKVPVAIRPDRSEH